MTVLLWGLGIGVGVLTVWAGKRYIDNVRDELHTDAYEQGWNNGYTVGQQYASKQYDKGFKDGSELKDGDLHRGFAAGWDRGNAAPKKKSVKSTKKITRKE